MKQISNHPTQNKISDAELLNSLLRTELSAKNTYQQVLQRSKPGRGVFEISQINEEHGEAIRILTAQILNLGVQPSQEAITWKTIELIAAHTSGFPLEDPLAIQALKEGEEQDILTYENALNSSEKPEVRQLISENLLPWTRSHIPTLSKLLSTI